MKFQMTIALMSICSTMTGFAQFTFFEAEVSPFGKRIKDIQVEIFGPAFGHHPAILSKLIVSKPGDVFTMDQKDRDIQALLSSGVVSNVEFFTPTEGTGVSLLYGVVCSGQVDEVKFSGNNIFKYEKLRRLIKIKDGVRTDGSVIEEGVAALRNYYAYAYHSDVRAEFELQPNAKTGFWTIIYKIEEGRRNFIKSVVFEGNKQINSNKLREIVKTKNRLEDNSIKKDLYAIERFYQDSGFAYAKVTEVRRDPVSETEISLCFVINEGDKLTVSEVQMSGNTAFSEIELKQGIGTESGFLYSGRQVSQDTQMIQDYYGSRGYADARVDVSILEAGKGKVSITFNIIEGEKTFVNRINITGNNKTRDAVIRREVLLIPGEELNTVHKAITKGVLEATNWFSCVDIRTTPTSNPNFRDVDINVTEKSTVASNFGFRYSSIDGAWLNLGFGNTNFSPHSPYSGDGIGLDINLDILPVASRFTLGVKSGLFLGGDLLIRFPKPKETSD